jgi:integrase
LKASRVLCGPNPPGGARAEPYGSARHSGKAHGAKKSAVEVPAFDADQAGRFLAAAQQHSPEHYPAFATMMLAGLRVGEALAVTPERIDIAKRTLRVDAQVGGTLKDDEPRTVDLAAPLVSILAALVETRSNGSTRPKVVTIAGSPQEAQPAARAGPWRFYPELGLAPTGKDEQRVYKNMARAFARLLRLAGLPAHQTPKSLRHTFGSGLISRGVSPAYVQEQMGHSSIEITVDVYGSSLPMKAPGAVDALAAAVLPSSDGSRRVSRGHLNALSS